MLYIFLIPYFGSLATVSIWAAIYLWRNRYKRAPLKELADYDGCPFWKEIQSDMGLITEYNICFNGVPWVDFNRAPRSILDIGSGNGVTSSIILSSVFGRGVEITLSDMYPNILSRVVLKNMQYNSQPIDLVKDTLKGYSMISLLNSLHHLNEETVTALFAKAQQANSSIFIMDAKRLPPYHPLLVPLIYYWIYVFLTISGIIRRGEIFKLRSLLQIAVVPWIMCVDQMIGSTRRYHMDTIREFARSHSFRVFLTEDSLMNYIILEPSRSMRETTRNEECADDGK
jgi:hypothetical protein